MIFDSHAHIFPDKIAEKASANIAAFYDMPVLFDGSVATLKRVCEESGVTGCLVCSVATKPEQVASINDFISRSAADSDGFMAGLCSLHPDMSQDELDSEIKRAVSIGLKGVKLHPDFQEFEADGAKAYKVYEVVGGRLPVLIHSGDSRFDWSSPKRLVNAVKRFGNMTVIAAHLGGWSEWGDAIKLLADRDNVYVDTSSSLYALDKATARSYIAAFGEDRTLFGTDYPMWHALDEIRMFRALELDEDVNEKILYGNAKKLFGL